MLRAPRGRRYVGVLVVDTLAVGLAVAAPAVADVNEITVARFDDPVGTETLVLRLECPDLCQLVIAVAMRRATAFAVALNRLGSITDGA
jgi:hypothetical protein